MEYYSSEIKSGLFVVISIIGLLLLLFFVGNFSKAIGDRNVFRVVTRNSEQIEKHAPVSYAGFNVGEVVDISLSEKKEGYIELTLELDNKIKIKKNSRFSIKSSSILGGKYVEIGPGTLASAELAPGSVINAEESLNVDALLKGGESIISSSNSVLGKLDSILGDPNVKNAVPELLTGLVKVVNKWHEVSEGLGVMVADKNKMVGTTLRKIDATVDNLLSASESFPALTASADRSASRLAGTAGKIDDVFEEYRPKINAAIDNLNVTSAKIVDISKHLDNAVLGTQNEVNNLIREVAKSVNGISKDTHTVSKKTIQLLDTTEKTIIENTSNIFTTTDNLKNASKNMAGFSKKIFGRPYTLIWKEDAPVEARNINNMEKDIWGKGRVGFYDMPQ